MPKRYEHAGLFNLVFVFASPAISQNLELLKMASSSSGPLFFTFPTAFDRSADQYILIRRLHQLAH